MSKDKQIIPLEIVERCIYIIRNNKVMLDSDLAKLYGVSTSRLNEQVKRNIKRFPEDFSFQLSQEEYDSLRSQFAILKPDGRGQHRKYLPRVFTEQGIAMLSGVLNSDTAIEVNIAIMRAFIHIREVLATHKDLAQKIEDHDQQITYLFELVNGLLQPPELSKKNPIGFEHPKKD